MGWLSRHTATRAAWLIGALLHTGSAHASERRASLLDAELSWSPSDRWTIDLHVLHVLLGLRAGLTWIGVDVVRDAKQAQHANALGMLMAMPGAPRATHTGRIDLVRQLTWLLSSAASDARTGHYADQTGVSVLTHGPLAFVLSPTAPTPLSASVARCGTFKARPALLIRNVSAGMRVQF
jgi:hypothetical protein